MLALCCCDVLALCCCDVNWHCVVRICWNCCCNEMAMFLAQRNFNESFVALPNPLKIYMGRVMVSPLFLSRLIKFSLAPRARELGKLTCQ